MRFALPSTLGTWHSLGVPKKANGRALFLREHAIRFCLENLNSVGGRFFLVLNVRLTLGRYPISAPSSHTGILPSQIASTILSSVYPICLHSAFVSPYDAPATSSAVKASTITARTSGSELWMARAWEIVGRQPVAHGKTSAPQGCRELFYRTYYPSSHNAAPIVKPFSPSPISLLTAPRSYSIPNSRARSLRARPSGLAKPASLPFRRPPIPFQI